MKFKLEDFTSKPLFTLADILRDRGWEPKEAFIFSLCLYLICCVFASFLIVSISFIAIPQGMTFYKMFIMSCILSVPFLIGIIGTTIGTYRLKGKV